MRFRAFQVDGDTLFFENFHEREAKNVRERSEQDASVLVGLIVSMIKKKNHSHLSYCSLEIVYAVKDCDSCDRALLYVCSVMHRHRHGTFCFKSYLRRLGNVQLIPYPKGLQQNKCKPLPQCKHWITSPINCDTISPTDFILGTKVQPNKAHSMTQVLMALTEGQGHRSWSNFQKNG